MPENALPGGFIAKQEQMGQSPVLQNGRGVLFPKNAVGAANKPGMKHKGAVSAPAFASRRKGVEGAGVNENTLAGTERKGKGVYINQSGAFSQKHKLKVAVPVPGNGGFPEISFKTGNGKQSRAVLFYFFAPRIYGRAAYGSPHKTPL